MAQLNTFPVTISYGSTFGPEFKTRIFEADSGYEQRNSVWSNGRLMCDIATGIQTQDELDKLLAFFRVVRGRGDKFRLKDWSDYTISNTVIGVGDGVKTQFQAIKIYAVSNDSVTRTITRLLASPATPSAVNEIQVNNIVTTAYTVDADTGIITFDAPVPSSEEVRIVYWEFDVPVRFDVDKISLDLVSFKSGSWNGIPVKEVRE